MPHSSRLSASDLLDALRLVSAVLADHSDALDRLDAVDDVELTVTDPLDPPGEGSSVAAVLAGGDLAATLAAAVVEAEGAVDFARLFDGLSTGARSAAVGTAGRDLAAVLGGMTEVLRNADHLDAERFALALEVGAEQVATDGGRAQAGSMPAVVAAAAAGALSAVDGGAELADAVITAADEGLEELETGPVANPVLAERGVVDAAAAGFLLILDTLASVITGEPLPTPPSDAPQLVTAGTRFVVRCQVQPHEGCGLESANWLESTWYELGELVEFDGLGATWRAELVTSLPGVAVEAVYEVGRPRELHIGLVDGAT